MQYFGSNVDTVIRADKKGKHYTVVNCLVYKLCTVDPKQFRTLTLLPTWWLVFYINDDNLFFKENLEHYVYKRFYNLL